MAFSCNNSPKSNGGSPARCQRNVYSKNGVETVYHYSYNTKEGVVDESSKYLYYMQKYDSLGNLVYYKGKYYPSLQDVDVSTYHYEIRNELDLSWDAKYTYKMEYNDTVFTKVLHGMAEDIPADCLGDVLHKLRAVALKPFPLFCRSDTHVGNTLSAEPILLYPGLHISKAPSGRQGDEQHPTLIIEQNTIYFLRLMIYDRFLHCPVRLPPEGYNSWVGFSPS